MVAAYESGLVVPHRNVTTRPVHGMGNKPPSTGIMAPVR